MNIFIGFVFVGLLSSVWTLIFGQVSALPFGLEQPMTDFMSAINSIRNQMPWMNTIWFVFTTALLVKSTLWIFEKSMMVIALIRGGG